MGLIGKYTMPETGLVIDNAYISTYGCGGLFVKGTRTGENQIGCCMIQRLPDNDPRYRYLRGDMTEEEAIAKQHKESYTAANEEYSGKYLYIGNMCVYASKQSRDEGKEPIGTVGYTVCVDDIDKAPMYPTIFAKLKKINPTLADG